MDKPKKHEDWLMAAIRFGEDDLVANRTGRLSIPQMIRIRKVARRMTAKWAVPLLVMIGGVSLCALTFMPVVSILLGVALIPIIALLFVGGALSVIDGSKTVALREDLRENRVLETEGRVALRLRSEGRALHYGLEVGAQRFTLQQPAFLAFKNGDPYRIFYTPRTKRIVAVEWLHEDDNLIRAADDDAFDTQPTVRITDRGVGN